MQKKDKKSLFGFFGLSTFAGDNFCPNKEASLYSRYGSQLPTNCDTCTNPDCRCRRAAVAIS